MRLQSDPTIIYGLGRKFDGNLKKRHLKQDSRYNSYLRVGLPPTPISNPGKDALIASVNPAVTDALYFVAKGDGSSYFSKTYREHIKAVNYYQKGIGRPPKEKLDERGPLIWEDSSFRRNRWLRKSTQIEMLSNFLKSQKQKVLWPWTGGTEFGEKCRKLFLTEKLDGLTEACLAFASRNEHILQKIKPALRLGHWVLCDRFSDSTIAYQGYGRGVEVKFLREMAKNIEKQLSEMRIIYVNTSQETWVERIKKRGSIKNKFDNSSKIFFEKVIFGYSNIVKERGNNIIQVDGNDEIKKVFSEILQSVPELEQFKTTHNHLEGIWLP